MVKPITPMVACDVFVLNENDQILLVKRVDDGTWCMPGGCQDVKETPAECAVRECEEESGYKIKVEELLGIFSSRNYEFVHYKFKDDVFVHILFLGKLIGGEPKISDETSAVGWFSIGDLPLLLDGHEDRIRFAYQKVKAGNVPVHYE